MVFNFTQFIILENLSILDLVLLGVNGLRIEMDCHLRKILEIFQISPLHFGGKIAMLYSHSKSHHMTSFENSAKHVSKATVNKSLSLSLPQKI